MSTAVYTVIRKKPLNLVAEDEHLFVHEYEKKFLAPDSYSYKLILSNTNFLWRKYDFLPKKNPYPKVRFHSIVSFCKALLTKKINLYLKPTVVITDSWSDNYFHWLSDALPKAFGAHYNSVIILPSRLKEYDFVEKSIQILSKKCEFVDPNNVCFFKKISFPAYSAPTGNYNPAITKQLREVFRSTLKSTTVTSFKNVYISRSFAGKRKIKNEEALIRILKEFDFLIVSCEKMSFEDQVNLFGNCNCIISNHGAGLTNMLFMGTGSKVIELRSEDDSKNNCYFSLASALDLDYYYLKCKQVNVIENVYTADIIVDTVAVENLLKEFI